jgi:hypothetical protein
MPGLCGSELRTDLIFSFIPPVFLLAVGRFPLLYRLRGVGVDDGILLMQLRSVSKGAKIYPSELVGLI